jgi:hypothetical protein
MTSERSVCFLIGTNADTFHACQTDCPSRCIVQSSERLDRGDRTTSKSESLFVQRDIACLCVQDEQLQELCSRSRNFSTLPGMSLAHSPEAFYH